MDGRRAFVSAPGDTESGTWAGSVYQFELPLPSSYCTAKTNSLGCLPFMDSLGAPSATGTAPFRIAAHDVLPGESGFLIYGTSKGNLNYHGGKLCVKLPLTRLLPLKTAQAQGAPPCSGVLFRDFNQRIQSGLDPLLTAGQTVRTQWVQRDPADPFFRDSLTDALQFTVLP